MDEDSPPMSWAVSTNGVQLAWGQPHCMNGRDDPDFAFHVHREQATHGREQLSASVPMGTQVDLRFFRTCYGNQQRSVRKFKNCGIEAEIGHGVFLLLYGADSISQPEGHAYRKDMAEKPDLAALYSPPAEMIQKAVFDNLVDVHLDYLRVATFFCIATGSPDGLDASPRGGPPGFVHVLDPHTIAFADWPGNNRIESMRNLELDDRVGMVFLFPGLEIFMRINGRARTVVDTPLLDELREGNKIPKTAMLIHVEQVIMHCGKAINRAKLWDPNSLVDRTAVPSIGKMLTALIEVSESQADHITSHYEHSVRNDLY